MSVREGEGIFVNVLLAGEHKCVLFIVPVLAVDRLNNLACRIAAPLDPEAFAADTGVAAAVSGKHIKLAVDLLEACLLYTSPSPRDTR